ncbi:MAG: hypothetical protein WBP56_06665 [Polyangia bacterium]
MAVFDIFSKRQKRLRGEAPDVYKYDEIPHQLRVQIIHIWDAALGGEGETGRRYGTSGSGKAYELLVRILRQEYGVFQLDDAACGDCRRELCDFLLRADVEQALDAVEIAFRAIDVMTRKFQYLGRPNAEQIATAAIHELNARFLEHGVGYAYESGEIVRIDSQFIHAEVVKPALRLLAREEFAGAQQEFLEAHDHYRNGRHKEAMAGALKSLESVLKSVCDTKGWTYDKNRATAKDLMAICFEKGLVPSFWESAMGNLRALLESGVPTARNRLGGHGQGSVPVEAPGHVVAFVLHMTAAAIVFLGQASDAK